MNESTALIVLGEKFQYHSHVIPFKQPDVELGQRKGLSERDIAKLNKMYRTSCDRNSSESSEDNYDDFFKDLINLFG